MSNKIRYIFIGLLCLFIFTVFFKGLEKSNNYTPTNISNNVESSFKAKTLYENTEVSFAELLKTNDFLLINIWASWCLPCRDEHNYLLNLKAIKNLDIIGINYKDKEANALKFLSEFSNPYTKVLLDSDGTKSIELGAYGVPESYLISSKNKTILKKYIGPLDDQKYIEIIKLINNEKI
tara:strand:- start:939 stop:1475 length:537 start_codon:yes stop_codon:yes gene_type:complete